MESGVDDAAIDDDGILAADAQTASGSIRGSAVAARDRAPVFECAARGHDGSRSAGTSVDSIGSAAGSAVRTADRTAVDQNAATGQVEPDTPGTMTGPAMVHADAALAARDRAAVDMAAARQFDARTSGSGENVVRIAGKIGAHATVAADDGTPVIQRAADHFNAHPPPPGFALIEDPTPPWAS
jgi:hypothetical protein